MNSWLDTQDLPRVGGKESACFLVNPDNGQVINALVADRAPAQVALNHWLRAGHDHHWQRFLNALRSDEHWQAPSGFSLRTMENDWTPVELSLCRLPGPRPVVLVQAHAVTPGLNDTWVDLPAFGHHRLILDNLTQSIFLKDRNLRFLAVNQAFCDRLGRSAEEIIGKDDFAFYPRSLAEKFRADDQRILEDGRGLEIEEKNLYEGRTHTVHVVKTPLYARDGSLRGILGIFWDVSEQRQLEAQLRQSQKMEAVAQLAGGIAHDFNNLLTGILGNIALARHALLNDQRTANVPTLLGEAEKAAQRAGELTRQLLGFSRRYQPHFVPLEVNNCIQESLRTFRQSLDSRITVHLHLAAHLWPVHADPGQIHQVLIHLANNARDAMHRGGFLTFETANVIVGADNPSRPVPGQPLQLPMQHADARPGEFVRLRCRDTGEGITPEVLQHLFEPYFSTKEYGMGSGLALAMVLGVVTEHHGWIECHSVVGEGTCFDIFLPRLVAGHVEPGHDESSFGKETILLVDDHEVVRRIARDILESHGYRVFTAQRGPEAVNLFRDHRQNIDLVILDLTVPKQVGQETLLEMRALDPGVNLLLSAAFPTGPALRAVDHFGALGFVAKPYQPMELTRTLRSCLDRCKVSRKG